MPIFALIGGWIATKFSRGLASIVAKIGLTTFQTILSGIVIALQILIVIAIGKIVVDLFNLMQTSLDYVFSLDSASSTLSTAVQVSKAVGVWDGAIDSIILLMPFFSSILLIKISLISIRLLKLLSDEANKIIKTALSYGV